MALQVQTVSKSLETFLLSLQENPTTETKQKIADYAKGLSTWLVETLTSATVTVAAGISVSTAGSPSAQTGATTSTGTGKIS